MTTALMVFLFIFLAFGIFCAVRESRTTGLYKELGVYGRFKAYLFADCIVAAIGIPVIGIIFELTGSSSDSGSSSGIGSGSLGSLFMYILYTVFMVALAVVLALLIYRTTLKKCPNFLQDRLFLDMFISGFGCAMKVSIFFMIFVWKLEAPREFKASNGLTYYIGDDGEVWNEGGTTVGYLDEHDPDVIHVRRGY